MAGNGVLPAELLSFFLPTEDADDGQRSENKRIADAVVCTDCSVRYGRYRMGVDWSGLDFTGIDRGCKELVQLGSERMNGGREREVNSVEHRTCVMKEMRFLTSCNTLSVTMLLTLRLALSVTRCVISRNQERKRVG
jgi:hypothetical protein